MSNTFRQCGTTRLTDSNNVCAECPKMKEKPRTIVASGTNDCRVFLLLKINKHTKIKIIAKTASITASSFATAEPTSCMVQVSLFRGQDNPTETNLETRGKSSTFAIDSAHGFSHFGLCDVAITIFVENIESCLL